MFDPDSINSEAFSREIEAECWPLMVTSVTWHEAKGRTMIPLVIGSHLTWTLFKWQAPPLTTRAPSKLREPSRVKFSKVSSSESANTK